MPNLGFLWSKYPKKLYIEETQRKHTVISKVKKEDDPR